MIDKEVYLKIWSMASSDYRIAETTISGESNLDKVIESIKRNNYHDDVNFDHTLVPWVYTQSYGGGSDEHFAVFYSKKRSSLDFIRSQLKTSYIIFPVVK